MNSKANFRAQSLRVLKHCAVGAGIPLLAVLLAAPDYVVNLNHIIGIAFFFGFVFLPLALMTGAAWREIRNAAERTLISLHAANAALMTIGLATWGRKDVELVLGVSWFLSLIIGTLGFLGWHLAESMKMRSDLGVRESCSRL